MHRPDPEEESVSLQKLFTQHNAIFLWHKGQEAILPQELVIDIQLKFLTDPIIYINIKLTLPNNLGDRLGEVNESLHGIVPDLLEQFNMKVILRIVEDQLLV